MQILSVPYYTTPELGDVHEEQRIVKIPLKMQDAVKLEWVWRNLYHPAYKWYLKMEYIDRNKPQVVWRKMKNHGVKIRSDEEHEAFNRKSLEYFFINLGD